MSWKGDASHVTETLHSDPEYILFKYNRGMDQYIYENVKYNTYTVDDGYVSFQTELEETDAPVYLFNQRYQELVKEDWYTKYQLQAS